MLVHRLPSLAVAVALALSLAPGCGGDQKKADNASWETRKGYGGLGEDDSGEVEVDSQPMTTAPTGWTGVRHDLQLRGVGAPRQASCSCLAVEVGSADDDKTFMWRGSRPQVDGKNLAIAISAQGVECAGGPANPADRRPSISAVDRIGKDVIVEVEEVPADRPLATGAILSPLEPGGQIFVKPRSKKVPYARPVGKELCRVK